MPEASFLKLSRLYLLALINFIQMSYIYSKKNYFSIVSINCRSFSSFTKCSNATTMNESSKRGELFIVRSRVGKVFTFQNENENLLIRSILRQLQSVLINFLGQSLGQIMKNLNYYYFVKLSFT